MIAETDTTRQADLPPDAWGRVGLRERARAAHRQQEATALANCAALREQDLAEQGERIQRAADECLGQMRFTLRKVAERACGEPALYAGTPDLPGFWFSYGEGLLWVSAGCEECGAPTNHRTVHSLACLGIAIADETPAICAECRRAAQPIPEPWRHVDTDPEGLQDALNELDRDGYTVHTLHFQQQNEQSLPWFYIIARLREAPNA